MHVFAVYLVAATLGIEVGWQRTPEGGMEYIIQLDPQTLESLKSGQTFESDVPPAAGNFRSFRIVLGNEKLPRETPPAEAPRTFRPDPGVKPFVAEQTTALIAPPVEPLAKQPNAKESQAPAKPWLPLVAMTLALFASLGGNLFLGLMVRDTRRLVRKFSLKQPTPPVGRSGLGP